MRIGELAKIIGVDVETIRYYEKIGLLAAPDRRDNGYRAYAQGHLERLAFVRHCRALDIPLIDIQRLLSLVDSPQANCQEIDCLVDAQLAKVRTRLTSMQALEQQLVALRGRCANPDKAADCGILRELMAAAHGEACACHLEATDRERSR